jgi:ATP-dependent Clp protease protease subunit
MPFTRCLALLALASLSVGCATGAHAAPPGAGGAKSPVGNPVVINDRVVEISGGVNFDGMKKAQKAVLEFAAQGDEPIWFRINSPGGSVDAGLILVDTMKAVSAPIHCVVESAAYSMAAIILTFCDKRYAMPHATIMLHEASYGMTGEDPSIRSRHDFLTRYLDRMHVEIAKNIGMDLKKYRERIRDAWWLLADEAKAANIVEDVVTHLAYEATTVTKTEEKKTLTWTTDRVDPGAQTIPKRRD